MRDVRIELKFQVDDEVTDSQIDYMASSVIAQVDGDAVIGSDSNGNHQFCYVQSLETVVEYARPWDFVEDPQARAVLTALSAHGIDVSYEYPGAVVIQVRDDLQLWTGLTGWDFASASRADVDGDWQPATDVIAEIDLPGGESPEEIGAAWAAHVLSHYPKAS